MNEFKLSEKEINDGYSLEKKEIDGRKYTFLYKEEKIVLALPTERCSQEKIDEVIKQTRREV